MNETEIQQRIRGVLNHRESPIRMFRNNVGSYQDPKNPRRWIDYGLAVGSADLIGIEKRIITADMVGQTLGLFTAVEVKTPKGRLSDEQKAWLSMIQSFGGQAIVMRSVEEAENYLKGRVK